MENATGDKSLDGAVGSAVTPVPDQNGQPVKSLGLIDRIRINRLYQQTVNGHGSAVSLFLAIVRHKKVEDAEIQNFGLAASAIVQKRNAFAQPQEVSQIPKKEMVGAEIRPATSEAIDGINFFTRTQCDSQTLFRLLHIHDHSEKGYFSKMRLSGPKMPVEHPLKECTLIF
jgi:hypothetical protein